MYRESLQNNREQILLSKKLATIHCDVPIAFSIEEVEAPDAGLERAESRSTGRWSSSAC